VREPGQGRRRSCNGSDGDTGRMMSSQELTTQITALGNGVGDAKGLDKLPLLTAQTEPTGQAKPRPRVLLDRTQHSVHRSVEPERQRLQQ
jgi:transketolase N-terminal domain/subunit